MERKIKKGVIYFFIIFVTIIFALLFAEAINYLQLSKVTFYSVWPPNLEYTFFPNSSIFYGINGESHFTINNLGYRGIQFNNHENEYRTLIIGGSTSECLYLDDKEAWPDLLMNSLKKTKDNKRIISMNIGKSGHGLRNNILELKYLPENYEPDLVIMMLGINDVLFKISRGDAWVPFNESEFDNTESYTFTLSPGYTWRSTITYKIYRYLSLKFEGIHPQDTFGNTLAENRLKRINSENWINKDIDWNASLEDYEKNLRRIISLSKEKNITLLFSTQPYLWKKNMSEKENSSLWMTTDFNGNFYSLDIMIEGMNRFNAKMLEVCRENSDIFCIDLEKEIPKTLDYFYDDVHFNEKGSMLVAEKIESYLKGNLTKIFHNL